MKFKALLLLAFCTVNAAFSQENNLENCKKPCDKTEIIKEDVFLGVKINTIGVNRVNIIEIVPNTAAEKQGLLVNDVITKLDGVPVPSHSRFICEIKSHKPEDEITLTFERDGKEITKKYILGWKTSRVVTSKICCDDLKQIALEKTLQIYPVPAKDKLTIESSELKGDYSVEVYNVNGSLIDSYQDNTEISGNKKVIDISKLPSSSYLVRISNNGKTVTKNFIKE